MYEVSDSEVDLLWGRVISGLEQDEVGIEDGCMNQCLFISQTHFPPLCFLRSLKVHIYGGPGYYWISKFGLIFIILHLDPKSPMMNDSSGTYVVLNYHMQVIYKSVHTYIIYII